MLSTTSRWLTYLTAFRNHAYAFYSLIIFITLAAIVYLRLFDFSGRPGGLIYLAAYFLVGIFFLLEFKRFETGFGN